MGLVFRRSVRCGHDVTMPDTHFPSRNAVSGGAVIGLTLPPFSVNRGPSRSWWR